MLIDITCPQCTKEKLMIRFGKMGEFLGCTSYPDCTFTSNFSRNEQGIIVLVKAEKPKKLKEKCPNCGKFLREIKGKFGDFISCSGYPECKYIKRNIANFSCPECGGQVVEKIWRGGKFWGCGNYPRCKFAIFDLIEEKPCPICKWPFLIKKIDKQDNTTLQCANKKCVSEKKKK